MMVLVGERPWFAKRRYHFLFALLGVNWRARDVLDEKSSYVQFTFEKYISSIKD
jgi:hypothetical protein